MKTKTQKNLDEMLRIKAEKERPGNIMPETFEYRGKTFDVKKLLAAICEVLDARAKTAQPGGAK